MSTPTRESIAAQFRSTYGNPPTVVARAPGRVEFIGNHTDYNGGAVLGVGKSTVARALNKADQELTQTQR